MKVNLPNTQEIKIDNLEDAKKIIELLVSKIDEIENRESIRDTGLLEEIFHLREETRLRLDRLESQVESYSFAIKSLGSVTKDGFERIGVILGDITKNIEK